MSNDKYLKYAELEEEYEEICKKYGEKSLYFGKHIEHHNWLKFRESSKKDMGFEEYKKMQEVKSLKSSIREFKGKLKIAEKQLLLLTKQKDNVR